uniref:Cyclin B n=1 Tax=Alexandrium fundyense TaxID=2932 RepID=U5N415_ALEFU|nr:cyclin B [Alexandrium fundyense]
MAEHCDSENCPLEAPVPMKQAWPGLSRSASVKVVMTGVPSEVDQRQDWSGSENSHGLGRCQSTANLKGYYLSGSSAPWPAQERDTPSDIFTDMVEVQSLSGPSPSDEGSAGIIRPSTATLRPALVDISNMGSMVNACKDRKVVKKSLPSLPDPNPQLVREYACDVMRCLLQRELHFLPRPDYMDEQPQINAKMRSILNDWLFEVHRKYTLKRETLFLAVNLTDRYLSHATVSRQRLQLVGVTALLIAAKFEEIEPPELADLVYVTADSYSRQDIMDMEIAMLGVFQFEIAAPTAANFLQHFHAAAEIRAAGRADAAPAQAESPRDQVRTDLAWYLVELALLDVRMIRHAPSHVAAAALLLSNKLAGSRPAWSGLLSRLSGYVEKELEACSAELGQLLEAAPHDSLQAIRGQYRHTEMLQKAASRT